uniref:CSON014547 protein n=1 Tax=Culicoides sonorensis TaxID=179676 RepID=A0A336MAT7_CULSO
MEKKRNSLNNTTLNLSGSIVSPKANSTKLVIGSLGSAQRTGVKRKPTSPLSSRNAMSKTSLGTICYNRALDAQTFTDITSKGLTTRLVRYGGNEEDTRPRQNSLRSAFIKTSPFPVLKLRKQDIKLTPQRSISLSNVRIAPPEKVIFQPNSRANILRSGSMISIQSPSNPPTRNDNEPLNPTISEPDTNPTRSVLDALKEISRKRINNEELDAERIKKQCKDVSEVDSPTFQNTIVDFTGNMTDLMYRSPMMQKRPRESNAGTQSGQASPQSAELEKQKKRLCTKNNEVMSSLSSSISLATPKRQGNELNVQRKGLDLNKDAPEDTPSINQQQNVRSGVIKETPQSNLVVQVPIKTDNASSKLSIVEPVKSTTTPKLTLFNKKIEDKPLELIETEKKIRFVKPKPADEQLESQLNNIKKVEQSKLAVLLQCLAGELDDDSEDMVDSAKKEEKPTVTDVIKPIEAPKIGISTQLTVETSQTNAIENKKEDTSKKVEKLAPSVSFKLPEVKKPEETQTVNLNQTNISFNTSKSDSPSSNLKPFTSLITTTAAPVVNSSTSSQTVPSSINLTSTTPSAFSIPTSDANKNVTSSVNNSFLFGNISKTEALPKPLIPTPTSAFASTATAIEPKPSFTFGIAKNDSSTAPSTSTTSNASNVQTSVTNTPQLSSFGSSSFVFGDKNQNNSGGLVTSTVPTFGSTMTNSGNTSVTKTTASDTVTFSSGSSMPTTTTANIFGSFGATNPLTPSQNQPSQSVSSPVFGFGTPTTSAPQVNNPSTIFGSSTTTTTSNTPAPVFGASVNTTPTTFNFGAKPSAPPAYNQAQQQNSMFDASANKDPLKSNQPSGGFSFTSPQNQTQSNTGGFSFNPNQNASAAQPTASKGSVFSRLGPTSTTTAQTTSQNPAVVSPSKSLFTFSSANSNPNQTGNTKPSGFESNLTNVSSISQTSSIFGGNTTLNNTTQNTTSLFGNSANQSSIGSNLFGNASQPTMNKPQTTFGSSNNNQTSDKTPFSFGSANQTTNALATENKSVFGSFGSGAGSGSANTNSAPAFGQTSTFTFGSTNNNNAPQTTPSSAPFAFGQSTNQPTENKPFTFGAASATPAPTFGSQVSQPNQEPPKFNFSAAGTNSPFGGNTNNNNPTFGSSTQNPPAFNFSAASGTNNNIFGSSSGGSTAGSTGSAFNFQAASQIPAPVQGGLSFNIGTGGGQQNQGRRPIRTATRRLNK